MPPRIEWRVPALLMEVEPLLTFSYFFKFQEKHSCPAGNRQFQQWRRGPLPAIIPELDIQSNNEHAGVALLSGADKRAFMKFQILRNDKITLQRYKFDEFR